MDLSVSLTSIYSRSFLEVHWMTWYSVGPETVQDVVNTWPACDVSSVGICLSGHPLGVWNYVEMNSHGCPPRIRRPPGHLNGELTNLIPVTF